MTYHHLKKKSEGGKATLENGALLCRSCHDWLEQLSRTEREKVNNELRRYKRQNSQKCEVVPVDNLSLGFKVMASTFKPEKQKRKYSRGKEKQRLRKQVSEEYSKILEKGDINEL